MKKNINDILAERFTTKWWEDTPVTTEQQNYIFDCMSKAPSKNSKYKYRIVATTSKTYSEWVYLQNAWCYKSVQKKVEPNMSAMDMRYNGQVNAPLVLTWLHERGPLDKEITNDIMICATIGMMAAQELGLNTGFCGCIEGREIADYLGMPDKEALMILGIGTAKPKAFQGDPRKRPVVRDGKVIGWDDDNVPVDFYDAKDRARNQAEVVFLKNDFFEDREI
tara:strand:- start:213 stop:878 length:666 start_codon:yes stop_codon:yes gene_type:complete